MKPLRTGQLHRIAVEAGLPTHAAPQLHNPLLEDGTDSRIIRALLGHAKLENTAFYTKVAIRTVRASSARRQWR